MHVLLALGFWLSLWPVPPITRLTVQVSNLKTLQGTLSVGLFGTQNNFPTGPSLTTQQITVSDHTQTVTFEVPPGNYAVALFHDENNNGRMDKRALGIPKEPYGFSNNVRPKFSAPTFKECSFRVGSEPQTVRIKIDTY